MFIFYYKVLFYYDWWPPSLYFFAHVNFLDKIIVLVFDCIPSNGYINTEHEQLVLFTSH